MAQEFTWQFYVALAAVAVEQHGPSSLSPTLEAARPPDMMTSDLARWDDDGGAPRS